MKNSKTVTSVLLIDDNHADNYYHEHVLSEARFAERIVAFHSASEALDYLRNKENLQPDVIFLDLNMPRTDGWQFLEQYRQFCPQKNLRPMVFILNTVMNQAEKKRTEESDLIDGMYKKPLQVKDLNAIRKKITDRSQG